MSSYTWLRPDPIWLITSTSLLIVNRNSTHLVPLEAVNRLFIQVVFAHQFLYFAAVKQFLVKASFVASPVFHSSVIPHLFLWRHHSSCFIPIGPTGESLISGCLYLTLARAGKKTELTLVNFLNIADSGFYVKMSLYDNAIIESEKSEDALNVFQDISSISFIMFINSVQLISVHCHKVLCLERDSRQKKRHKENVEEEK